MTSPTVAAPQDEPDVTPELPSADLGRGRVRMDVRHLAVLAQRLARNEVQPELARDEAELIEAGILGPDGTVPAELTDLVASFASPDLLAEVETGSAGRIVRHPVVVRASQGWSAEGWPGSRLSEYVPFEAPLLVPVIARLAGLRSLPEAALPLAEREPITVPLVVAERALSVAIASLSSSEGVASAALATVTEAVASLTDDAAVAERFSQLVIHLRQTWRVTVREAADSAAPTSLAVVDAGSLGLWRRDEPGEPLGSAPLGRDAVLTLVPVTPGDAWRGIVALLPAGTPSGSRP